MLESHIVVDFSSKKLENMRAEQVLPESKGRRWGGWRGGRGRGGPNNVYTYE
jgi:hypothetical protein